MGGLTFWRGGRREKMVESFSREKSQWGTDDLSIISSREGKQNKKNRSKGRGPLQGKKSCQEAPGNKKVGEAGTSYFRGSPHHKKN